MPIDDVDDLRIFVQIARSRSLTAAARALGMTKNGVSRRMLRLEGKLGVRLLQRTSRKTALTEEGAAFLEPSLRVLDAVDLASESVVPAGRAVTGELRISIPSQFASALTVTLPAFLGRHPGASVSLRVSDSPGHVVSEGLDVAVVAGPVPSSALAVKHLGEVDAMLAATPAYLDRRGRPRTTRELAVHDCLLYGDDRAEVGWRLVDDRGRVETVAVRGRLRSSSSIALRDALRAGLGIGLATRSELDEWPGLERVLPRHRFAPFPLSAVFDPSARRSPRLRAALELLEETARRVARPSRRGRGGADGREG